MGSYSYLLASRSSGPAPDFQGRTISSVKDGIAVGWVFLFADEDRLSYRPEGYSEDLFYFKAPRDKALARLRTAIDAFSVDAYLRKRLGSLEKLRAALETTPEPWVLFVFEEIIFMGWGAGKTLAGLQQAPGVLAEAVTLAREKRFRAVREKINLLKGVGGFKLHGAPWRDHLWWWIDRKFTGIQDDQELCEMYVTGTLEPEKEASP